MKHRNDDPPPPLPDECEVFRIAALFVVVLFGLGVILMVVG